MVWQHIVQHICKRIVQHEFTSIILFSKPKIIESLYQHGKHIHTLVHLLVLIISGS
jgi:hypothetical protein